MTNTSYPSRPGPLRVKYYVSGLSHSLPFYILAKNSSTQTIWGQKKKWNKAWQQQGRGGIALWLMEALRQRWCMCLFSFLVKTLGYLIKPSWKAKWECVSLRGEYMYMMLYLSEPHFMLVSLCVILCLRACVSVCVILEGRQQGFIVESIDSNRSRRSRSEQLAGSCGEASFA